MAKEVITIKLKEKWLQDELEAYAGRIDGIEGTLELLIKQRHEVASIGREIWDKLIVLYKLDGEKYRFSYNHKTKEINCLPRYGRTIAKQFSGGKEKG